MEDTIGFTVLPSVNASTDTSGPVRNSSTTTWLPACAERFYPSMMEWTASLACFRFSAIRHAFAQRQSVGLDDCRETVLPAAIYSSASAGSVKHLIILPWECRIFSSGFWKTPCCPQSAAACCMRAESSGSLLLPARRPFPAARGSSGATNYEIDFLFFRKAQLRRPISIASISAHIRASHGRCRRFRAHSKCFQPSGFSVKLCEPLRVPGRRTTDY